MDNDFSPPKTRDTGFTVESRVLKYLTQQGLQLLETNFSCKCGEIDIIMRDQEHIVFIEVRYRKQCQFGAGAETVNYHKQRKIIKSALLYLQKKQWLELFPCRFDVIEASTLTDPAQQLNCRWIKNAFDGHY